MIRTSSADANVAPDGDNTRGFGTALLQWASGHFKTLFVDGEQVTKVANPAGDRLPFFDHSAVSIAYLTTLTGLSISGTTLTAALRNYRREGKCLPLRNSGSHNKTPAMLRPILRRSPWNRKGSKSLKPNNN